MSLINPMYASMGLSVGQAATSFASDMIASSLANKLRKYRNTMLEITAAMTGNTITLNQHATRDASIRLQFDIAKQAAADQGSAEVAAAAAGVAGQSVNSAMRGLRSSAAAAQAARKAQRSSEFRAHSQERRNLAIGTLLGKDISVTSKPSIMSAAVGLGKSLIDDFDRAQPEGEKLGDQMKKWWEH